ncbi:toll/interleukin-1 receptor domain-containing protein [Methylosinus sp. LW4]|uniref:toll/interleukin-1 receptor domain-containing protein n=1 Tax=Methylosinus sp. LW4 TaxID=136993 RepID=UPI00039DA5D1|nr:TIR domain-containing protein [Methylosinus sp. LW4]
MDDVFVSYAREDAESIRKIVDALRLLGVSVWSDARIGVGAHWDEELEEHLGRSRAVLVCWSASAVKSKWVKAEASHALDHDKLVPCFLEICKPPIQFQYEQTEDLSGWDSTIPHDGWQKILSAISVRIGRPGISELFTAKMLGGNQDLLVWVQSHPDDPEVMSIVGDVKTNERLTFEKELNNTKSEIKSALNRSTSRVMEAIDEVANLFNSWLNELNASSYGDRPSIAKSILSLDGTFYAAEISKMDEKRNALEIENDSLKKNYNSALVELDRLRTDRHASAVRSRWLGVAGGMTGIAGVVIGSFFFHADCNINTNDMKSELSDAQTQLAAMKLEKEKIEKEKNNLYQSFENAVNVTKAAVDDIARRENEKLLTKLQNAEHERDKVKETLEVAIKERDTVRAKIPPNAVESELREVPARKSQRPTETEPRTEAVAYNDCTRLAGNRFDDDNGSHDGPLDMSALTATQIQDAIRVCGIAAKGAGSRTRHRQIFAQLGRASAALAEIYANIGDRSGALVAMKDALANWSTAQKSGSAYAMNMLGAYYDGVYGRELKAPDENYFENRRRDEAKKWWKQAVDNGNSVAMVNLAGSLLESNGQATNRDDVIAAIKLLEQAKQRGNPRSYIAHAKHILIGNLDADLSTENRRQRAAAMAEQAACLGGKEMADEFFVKNKLLGPYRPLNQRC